MGPELNGPSAVRWGALALTVGLLALAAVVHAGTPGATAPDAVAEAKAAADEGPPPDPYTQAGQVRTKLGRQHTPSPLIVVDQEIPIRFSHRLHVGELKCVECHKTIPTSLRASDVNLPAEATCFDCHDVDDAAVDPPGDPPATCSTCHPGYVPEFPPGTEFSDTHKAKVHPAPIVFPAPNLKFNHKLHLDKGATCGTCHGDMSRVDLATRENALPVMGTCLTCHDGKKAPAECGTCHVTNPDGRIDTEAGSRPLKPEGWYFDDGHDDRWLHDHRKVAITGQESCNSCHTPKDCIDCHNGVQKPLKIHPNNWVLSHPIAARRNDPDCSSCHRSQTFCVNCHQQTRVVWEPGGQGKQALDGQGIRFHPEGWVQDDFLNTPRGRKGPNHHSFHAQRNIRACVSCHTEETCLTCHNPKVFGSASAVNPHPPGFAGSQRCKAMFKRNHRACVKCHELNEPALQQCR